METQEGGGLLFEMNAANIEIGFYKTIGLMKTFFNHDTIFERRYYLEKKPMGLFWRWSSFRDNFCKLKRGSSFRDRLLLEIKP